MGSCGVYRATMSSDQLDEGELIEKLVTRWHLSVPERALLPQGRARGSLIKAAIAAHVTADG